ncbi:uncharacterized protein PHACADRAFT_246301 [Phanerochaete carnosa HHB-10118-sp]|uniref:Survival Motor Neuron Gemin2-binding domain-containing protein n=1 Tax=Phanerochaete carnosa (strain HHB-10118-sp) TaxID=650164 RepID=K5VBW5_PHACS|nr:uncharacterized protein PHACADRAFT_246301 [Phanerochaete carnosa HHB-10118-sp]EKM60406.1 hypothetical protein PHACADRAFT_246301 [Phanerochaete carnosa HHB-10118-sp]
MSYSNGASGADEYEDHAEEEEELTHEDIWDDSALIDAWNSATAEYEAYHGKTKKWKEEPVKRSPLWYNVPPSPSKLANSKGKSGKTSAAVAVSQAVDAADSKPVDFNTFVPSHDPSLARTSGTAQGAESLADHSQSYLPGPTGPIVGQDEAFEKALSAMYWSGYWTAAYHYHGHYQNQGGPSQADGEAEDEANDEVDEVDAMMDDLIETQR